MVWKEFSAIVGDKVKLEVWTRCLWMGILLCSLFSDFDILTGYVSAYLNNYARPDSKVYDSNLGSNFTNIIDARSSLLTKISCSDSNAEEGPVITAITATPNPST